MGREELSLRVCRGSWLWSGDKWEVLYDGARPGGRCEVRGGLLIRPAAMSCGTVRGMSSFDGDVSERVGRLLDGALLVLIRLLERVSGEARCDEGVRERQWPQGL